MVGRMIVAYRCSDDTTTNYQIAWVIVALQHLRVGDDAWARIDPRVPMAVDPMIRRAQHGHVAAPVSLLALASSRKRQVMARRDPLSEGQRVDQGRMYLAVTLGTADGDLLRVGVGEFAGEPAR